MRKPILNHGLAVRLNERQRMAIESLAEAKEISLGEAARAFLSAGIEKMHAEGV